MKDSFTKKDLEERFRLSDNTIYKTLKVCGLDTSKTNYSNEEIESRFVPARQILEGGGNYKDIEDFFHLKDSKASSNGRSYTSPSSGLEQPEAPHADDFMDIVQGQVSDSINEAVKAAVSQIIPYIPRMASAAMSEAARNGTIRAAFERFRQDFVSGRDPYRASDMSGFGSVVEMPIAGLGEFIEVTNPSDFPEFVTDSVSNNDSGDASNATA